MTVYQLGITIVGSIATGRDILVWVDLKRHLRTPRSISIIELDTWISVLVSHTEHPCLVRSVETSLTIGIFCRRHHRISCLCLFGIFFSLIPFAHYEVGTGLQTINDRNIRSSLVRTLIASKIFLCLVEVGDDEVPHLFVGSTRVVVHVDALVIRNDRHGLSLWILGISLVGIHLCHILIEEGAHGVCDTHATLLLFCRIACTHLDDSITVLDPRIIYSPWNLTHQILWCQHIEIIVPDCEKSWCNSGWISDILTHKVTLNHL